MCRQLNWAEHKVSVSGFVSKPFSFTMDELESWPTLTFPVTLTVSSALLPLEPIPTQQRFCTSTKRRPGEEPYPDQQGLHFVGVNACYFSRNFMHSMFSLSFSAVCWQSSQGAEHDQADCWLQLGPCGHVDIRLEGRPSALRFGESRRQVTVRGSFSVLQTWCKLVQ